MMRILAQLAICLAIVVTADERCAPGQQWNYERGCNDNGCNSGEFIRDGGCKDLELCAPGFKWEIQSTWETGAEYGSCLVDQSLNNGCGDHMLHDPVYQCYNPQCAPDEMFDDHNVACFIDPVKKGCVAGQHWDDEKKCYYPPDHPYYCEPGKTWDTMESQCYDERCRGATQEWDEKSGCYDPYCGPGKLYKNIGEPEEQPSRWECRDHGECAPGYERDDEASESGGCVAVGEPTSPVELEGTHSATDSDPATSSTSEPSPSGGSDTATGASEPSPGAHSGDATNPPASSAGSDAVAPAPRASSDVATAPEPSGAAPSDHNAGKKHICGGTHTKSASGALVAGMAASLVGWHAF